MDTNRIITIEELKKGDEIIVAAGSSLRYFKVIRPPKKTKKGGWGSAYCSTHMTEEVRTWYAGKPHEYNTVIRHYICTPDEHQCELRVTGLAHRSIWLVKREGIW